MLEPLYLHDHLRTKELILLIEIFNSCERKYLNLDVSNIPAIPTILDVGNFEYFEVPLQLHLVDLLYKL